MITHDMFEDEDHNDEGRIINIRVTEKYLFSVIKSLAEFIHTEAEDFLYKDYLDTSIGSENSINSYYLKMAINAIEELQDMSFNSHMADKHGYEPCLRCYNLPPTEDDSEDS